MGEKFGGGGDEVKDVEDNEVVSVGVNGIDGDEANDVDEEVVDEDGTVKGKNEDIVVKLLSLGTKKVKFLGVDEVSCWW